MILPYVDFFQRTGAWYRLKDFMNGRRMTVRSNLTMYILRMVAHWFLLLYSILGKIQKEKLFTPSPLSQLHLRHLWNGFMVCSFLPCGDEIHLCFEQIIMWFVHSNRMPVILGSKESTDWWLDDSSLSNLDKILKPYEETDLAWYPVTPAIDEISFDGPECIKEVKLEETKTISQFFSKKQASKSEDQTPIKEELQECITPEIEKDKPQNQYTVESAAMKDEASVMEEPKQETTKMELIEDENLRLLTLKKRKEELKQELHQLTTLCDIPACMIIHDLATNSTSIWPEDSAQVRGLIDSYKADPSALRAYGVSDFISERQKNVEEKVVKLRKTNAESKYPSRDDRLDLMNESQLRELSAALRTESQAVRSLIIKCRNTKRKGCSSPVHGNTFSRIESERSELGREYVLGSHNPAGSLMLITHTHCFSVCVTLASASL
ncbi:uncharacterized protein LOC121787531 isoform X3 [Salvia splendens]|uniref:uncharacterized protein LOC121787531 isoform X3 n=1 Tax=Salvia splendens TaxID=180675 RepID=UPI001C25F72A|nr:uncharacterized protein LOC121787531 isoform X3 [Salvia splendens]XP_042042224.1 uncharacterized protein LOC121787531 isoform X3 [Salvia splendens]